MNSLSWHLAWRYLRRHPRRRHTALSTVVSIAGVALGVAALIIVMGVLSGLENFIRESVITVDAPLMILPEEGLSLNISEEDIVLIEDLDQVLGLSPYVQGEAIMRMPSRGTDAGCRVRGVDPSREFALAQLNDKLSYGELLLTTPEGEEGVLMGLYLAEEFYHSLDDTVYIFPPRAFFSSRGTAIGRVVFTGALETGLPVNDETLAYVDIDLARRMFLPEGGYSGIKVYTVPEASPEETLLAIEPILPSGTRIITWKELNPHLTASMKLERMGAFLALLLITLVATFNIMGTISRSAIERRKDISVMKAMGASGRLIFSVFLWEGVMVGLAGVIMGIAAGMAGCWLIGSSGLVQLPDVYSFHESIPVDIAVPQVVLVSLVALGLSLLSGILPAMKAAALDPVKGLES